MRKGRILVLALAACLTLAALTDAQSPLPQAPSYKYAITPQAGAWFICVKSYKGEDARGLSEDLAEFIRSEYKLPAYLFDWGRKQRGEEIQRINDLCKQHEDFLKS